MHINVRLPSPLGTLRFTADGATPVGALLPPSAEYYIRTRARLVDASTPVSELAHSDTSFPIDLELVPRVLGGKGGFGANLRAAGGRMNASKSTNFDSCRDLNGRRLGAVKEAQRWVVTSA
jgi:hypothetical protein